ncbi:hypothetical protein M569_02604, partial [Genlisea aurea]
MAQVSQRNTRSRAKISSDSDVRNPRTPPLSNGGRSLFRFSVKDLFLFGTILFVGALLINNYLLNLIKEDAKPRVITPLPTPKLTDLPMFQGEHRESLYWGTYRPHVYFGVRTRSSESLLAGLMWIGVKDGRYSLRHVCQDSDELSTYGWIEHNGRDYGHQILVDHNLRLTTSFLKKIGKDSGYGGDWVVRIEAQTDQVSDEEMAEEVHLFFYLADEGGNALHLGESDVQIPHDRLLAFGSRSDVGDWELHLGSKDEFEFHYAGYKISHIHNITELVQTDIGTRARTSGRSQLSDTSDYASNILIFQISAKIPFRADIAFLSRANRSSLGLKESLTGLTGDYLNTHLEQKHKQFEEKFQRIFNVFDKLDDEAVTVGRAALANLLGGIGYFYGQSKISVPPSSKPTIHGVNCIPYWPAELYSAVPSRPFFPRGFLWDEGFHQLIIWRWDVDISLDIMGHWLDLMNADGWIPREQILGAEALSKVPAEFVLQHPTNGNPPTLFLALRELVCAVQKSILGPSDRNHVSLFLKEAYARLDAWFKWFNITQSGKDPGTYFWHGRDNVTTRELNPKSLSSGLDDYPRASHPNEDERHLDLRCWMYLAAECMSSIFELLGDDDAYHNGKAYGSTAALLSDFELLNQMHFDRNAGAYFDYGNHTEKVRLSWQTKESSNGYPTRELLRQADEEPTPSLVPHIGYVSLFPFMTRLIPPESEILAKQLDIISNTSLLWTKFGLRSLAKTSSVYMQRNTEHDPPYWRGTIWMNMNYMILSSLNYYSKVDGPYRERAGIVYNDLRNNLIRNVVKNYRESGFLWEQYEQKKGKGKGARLFTGWTSLIVLIMAEQYSN